MKNLKSVIAAAILVVSSLSIVAQTDSVYIYKYVDEMNDKTFHIMNRTLIIANDEKTIGFVMEPVVNDLKFKSIIGKVVGLGACNQNDELIILFANGEKIIRKSWNDFNCEGTGYFDMNASDLNLLANQPMEKIRITNGYTHESYTATVRNEDRLYFIKLFYALENRIIKPLKD